MFIYNFRSSKRTSKVRGYEFLFPRVYMCVHYYFVGLLQIYLLNKIYTRTGVRETERERERALKDILQFELVIYTYIYVYIHARVCVKERGREKDGIYVSY